MSVYVPASLKGVYEAQRSWDEWEEHDRAQSPPPFSDSKPGKPYVRAMANPYQGSAHHPDLLDEAREMNAEREASWL